MNTTTLKVLVVDDDEDIRDVLRELLAEEGFYVRTAQDGREALEVLKQESGWVVLLDMRMPVLDGMAFLREVERNRRLQTANKIAIMSAGWEQPLDSSRLQNKLVKAFLPKPFELDTVVDVVHQLAS
ncbi:MAG TPA: response regulator [Ktedonobacterales bacterium]|nr:response regulator [Ktedonobacterales bacterium]